MKELRESKSLTQKQVAEKLGVTIGYISSMERGKRKLSVEKIIVLADIYNVSVETILHGLGYQGKARHIVITEKSGGGVVASIANDDIIFHEDYTADIEFI